LVVVMHTLGKANWRLPAILDRRLPHLHLEDHADRPTAGKMPPRTPASSVR
jgi:putative drug exporter of the RND superfamily